MRKKHGVLFFSLLVLAAVAACLPKAKPETFVHSSGELLNTREVRVVLYELTNRLSGRVQAVSGEVYRGTDDPAVQRDAQLLKTELIPALHRSSFQPDPVLAAADIWLLIVQMRDWLDVGPGRERFGEYRPRVLSVIDEMEQELRETFVSYGGPELNEENRRIVHEYAREHPIGPSLATRTGAAAALANRVNWDKMGATAAAGTLVDGFSDLSDRIAIYGEQLPRQARWHAELLLDERGLTYVDVEKLARDVEHLAGAANRLDAFLEEFPDEVEDSVDAVWPRLEATIAELDLAPYEALANRVVDRHMQVALAAITAERVAALEAVSHEREIALADAEELANRVVDRTMDQAFGRARGLLELPIGVTVVLGLALLAGPFALGLVAGNWLRGRSRA